LIFFNHPIKLGDYIKVLHKDFHFEGEVTEMNYFFVHIKTNNNELITIPNSHFFNQSYSVIDKNEKAKKSTK
jgi:small-conductance mechanosensitive channel